MPPPVKRPSDRFSDEPPPPFQRPTESLDESLDDPQAAGPPAPPPLGAADYTAMALGLAAPNALPPPLNAPTPGNWLRAGTAGVAGGIGHFGGALSEDLMGGQLTWARTKEHLSNALKTGLVQGGLEYATPVVGQALSSTGRRVLDKSASMLGNALKPASAVPTPPPIVGKAEEAIEHGYNLLGTPSKDRTGLLLSQQTADAEEGSLARFAEGFASGAVKGERITPALKTQRAAMQATAHEVKDRAKAKVDQIAGTPGHPGVEDDAFNTLRARVGTQPIIDVTPVVLALHDPRNAITNRVITHLKNKYAQAPHDIGDIMDIIEGRIQGPNPRYVLSLDQAQRFKKVLGKIGFELKGTDADLASGAKDLTKAVDDRISAGLRIASPPGQNFARDYATAKSVTEAKLRFERMGEILEGATDKVSNEITAQGLNRMLQKQTFADLAEQIGAPNAKRLHDLVQVLEIGSREPGGIGKIVIAMKTGKYASRIAEGAGGVILGMGAAGMGGLSAMGMGGVLLATPTFLGRLLTNPRFLDAMKSGATRPGLPSGSTISGVGSAANASLRQLAAVLGADYLETPSNPETALPTPVGPRFEQAPAPPGQFPPGLTPEDDHERAYLAGRGGSMRPDDLKESLTQYRALKRSDQLQARP